MLPANNSRRPCSRMSQAKTAYSASSGMGQVERVEIFMRRKAAPRRPSKAQAQPGGDSQTR